MSRRRISPLKAGDRGRSHPGLRSATAEGQAEHLKAFESFQKDLEASEGLPNNGPAVLSGNGSTTTMKCISSRWATL